jgi:hypothetical protein
LYCPFVFVQLTANGRNIFQASNSSSVFFSWGKENAESFHMTIPSALHISFREVKFARCVMCLSNEDIGWTMYHIYDNELVCTFLMMEGILFRFERRGISLIKCLIVECTCYNNLLMVLKKERRQRYPSNHCPRSHQERCNCGISKPVVGSIICYILSCN